MDDRPSAWLAGAGLGLCLGSGVLLGAYAGHVMPDLGHAVGLFLGLFTFGLGSAPFVEWGARGLWAVVSTVIEAGKSWGAPSAPAQPQITRQEGAPIEESESRTAEIDRLTRANVQRRRHWDVFWQRLMQAGDAYGFTNSILTTEGAPTRVMSDDAWKKVIPYAVYSGVLVGGKPGHATKWAKDYDLERFEAEALWKMLPHPTFDPPDIAEGPYHATPQHPNTPRATPASQAVIDS